MGSQEFLTEWWGVALRKTSTVVNCKGLDYGDVSWIELHVAFVGGLLVYAVLSPCKRISCLVM